MADTDTQGILYTATGAKYIRAAIQSAESVRKHSPGLSIHLNADWQDHGFDFSQSPDPFTSIESVVGPHRRSKVDYMVRTPFDRTLFLDTDTKLNADIRGVFQVLDRFDIALCHAHTRNTHMRLKPWRNTLPDAFPQYNGGVILFKKTPAVMAFMDLWRRCFHEAGFLQDQMTLRELLWESDLRIATLPPEYNVRFIKYHFMWNEREATSKIFHRRRYHDGPFWVVSWYARRVGRRLARMGIAPSKWLPNAGK